MSFSLNKDVIIIFSSSSISMYVFCMGRKITVLLYKFKNVHKYQSPAVPVVEWLRLLIVSALIRSSSHPYGLKPSSGNM